MDTVRLRLYSVLPDLRNAAPGRVAILKALLYNGTMTLTIHDTAVKQL